MFASAGESGWVSRDPEMGSGGLTSLAIFQRERPIPERVIAHKTPVAYDTALYAGTNGNGVFRSQDGGASWRDRNEGLADLTIRALLVDRAGTVYAGTAAGGPYRRGDAEDRWSPVGTALPKTIHALAADPLRARVLYAGAATRLFRSRDGGKTWASLPVGTEPDSKFVVSSLAVDPTAPDTVFAAGRISCRACAVSSATALFKSIDGGASWMRMAANVGGPLLFGPGDSSILYGRDAGGAAASRDGGSTWTAAGEHGQTSLAAVLAIDPDWPGRLYGRSAAGGLVRVDARCSPDARTLCLQDGRFRVQVEWGSGVGRVEELGWSVPPDD